VGFACVFGVVLFVWVRCRELERRFPPSSVFFQPSSFPCFLLLYSGVIHECKEKTNVLFFDESGDDRVVVVVDFRFKECI
jgi:hypothetical protein